MAVWVSAFSFASLYISATLACNGCQFGKDITFKSCADTTEDIVDFKWESIQMTDDCHIQTNFSRVIKEKITSAKIKVEGEVNGYPYNYEHPDICEALKDRNFDGKDVSTVLSFYEIADGCENPTDYSNFEIRKRKMDEKLVSMVDKGKGSSKVKMELLDVNGKEGNNACFEVETNIICEKSQRKPKGH